VGSVRLSNVGHSDKHSPNILVSLLVLSHNEDYEDRRFVIFDETDERNIYECLITIGCTVQSSYK